MRSRRSGRSIRRSGPCGCAKTTLPAALSAIGNTGRRTLPPAVRRWRSLTPPAPSGRSSRACSASSPQTPGAPAVSRLLSVKNVASPARACRRRRISRPTAALLSCCLAMPGCALPTSARATASCSTPGAGWCVARRIAGSVRNGELGFRFGEPLDVDGDGHADIAAGARFKLWHGTQQNGSATVWSGASGAPIREWDGEWNDGLFRHWVMPVPDLSGDGLADVVIAAPHAQVDGIARGILVARSPKTGEELWQHAETAGENLGWDLALAGDQNGDGRVDLFVGAPAELSGRVYLVSGKDGSVLRTYAPATHGGTFGWYVDRLDDLDGDGTPTSSSADSRPRTPTGRGSVQRGCC